MPLSILNWSLLCSPVAKNQRRPHRRPWVFPRRPLDHEPRRQILRQVKAPKCSLYISPVARLQHSEIIYRSKNCPPIFLQRPGFIRTTQTVNSSQMAPPSSPAAKALKRSRGSPGCSQGSHRATNANSEASKDPKCSCRNHLRPDCNILRPYTDPQKTTANFYPAARVRLEANSH